MPDNPYEPPPSPSPSSKNWWEKFLDWLSPQRKFLNGRPLICHGILFHLDPEIDSIVFAACPNTDFSQARVQLILNEVEAAYADLKKKNSSILEELMSRSIEIHLVTSYGNYRDPKLCLSETCSFASRS